MLIFNFKITLNYYSYFFCFQKTLFNIVLRIYLLTNPSKYKSRFGGIFSLPLFMNSYFLINKPYRVLTQFSPSDGKLTLKDIYSSLPTDVYPVGRLDYESEGLLILTNDKALNRKLLLPEHHHQREYWVQVDGAINQEAISLLKSGVTISINKNKFHTLPCLVDMLPLNEKIPERNPPIRIRKSIPAPWIRMILQEGKNHQVRKMTAAVGFPTLRLIRYRIESLSLEKIPVGGIMELSQELIYAAIR